MPFWPKKLVKISKNGLYVVGMGSDFVGTGSYGELIKLCVIWDHENQNRSTSKVVIAKYSTLKWEKMRKKCDFGLKINFDWPPAQSVNLSGTGSVHLTTLVAVRVIPNPLSSSTRFWPKTRKNNNKKKTNVFLTCHVAARSPGPWKLIFLLFDTHRIKKSHGES